MTRKKYVASLEQRTPQQIAEEDALYIELKRLEQTERRFKKDRDELLRTLLGVESGLPDIPVEDEAPVNGNGLHIDTAAPPPKDVKKTKKRGANDVDTPTSAGPSSVSVISLGQSAQKKAQSAKDARYGPFHFEYSSCQGLTSFFLSRCATLYTPYRRSPSHFKQGSTYTSLSEILQAACT